MIVLFCRAVELFNFVFSRSGPASPGTHISLTKLGRHATFQLGPCFVPLLPMTCRRWSWKVQWQCL